MARRKQGSSGARSKQSGSVLSKASFSGLKDNISGFDYRGLANKVRGNTLLMNSGIGVGAFFLTKYAIRYYKSNPAIGEFIRENLDLVESKFREYRASQGTSSESEDNLTDARH